MLKELVNNLRSVLALKLMIIALDVAPASEKAVVARAVRQHISDLLPSAIRDHQMRRG